MHRRRFDQTAGNSYWMTMRLVEDTAMAEWLQQLAGAAQDFDWDAGNLAKHRKHA